MQVKYLPRQKLSISWNCSNNVLTNTVSHNCQHFVLHTHFGRMYLRRQHLQALKRVHLWNTNICKCAKRRLVSYNVIAISKPHRTNRIQLQCDIFRTCVLMIQRDIILSDTSRLSLLVGSLIVQNVVNSAVHPHACY